MGESKKKVTPSPKTETPAEGGPSPLGQLLSHEEMEALSALQLVDLIAGKLPPQHSSLMDLIYLRDRITALEEMNDQASHLILGFVAQAAQGTALNNVAHQVAQIRDYLPEGGRHHLTIRLRDVMRSLPPEKHGPISEIAQAILDCPPAGS